MTVDGLVLCNKQVFRSSSEENQSTSGPSGEMSANVSRGSDHETASFPFSEGIPFIATLWTGAEGFHMTVNGRHETSFAYREVRYEYYDDHIEKSSYTLCCRYIDYSFTLSHFGMGNI